MQKPGLPLEWGSGSLRRSLGVAWWRGEPAEIVPEHYGMRWEREGATPMGCVKLVPTGKRHGSTGKKVDCR